MLDIQRKDMPLKGWITTYETTIKDPKMDKQIQHKKSKLVRN